MAQKLDFYGQKISLLKQIYRKIHLHKFKKMVYFRHRSFSDTGISVKVLGCNCGKVRIEKYSYRPLDIFNKKYLISVNYQ